MSCAGLAPPATLICSPQAPDIPIGIANTLDTLKTYDHEPGAPDLARVVGLYVHVDESNLAPDASGTLWIDDLALVRAVETPGPVLR